MTVPAPIDLRDVVSRVPDLWSPRVVAALNGQYLKVARVQGEFIWHQHEGEDELFLILKGTLRIQLQAGELVLREGQCAVIPRGVLHNPVADEECWIALFEPAETTHTGNVASARARSIAEQLGPGAGPA